MTMGGASHEHSRLCSCHRGAHSVFVRGTRGHRSRLEVQREGLGGRDLLLQFEIDQRHPLGFHLRLQGHQVLLHLVVLGVPHGMGLHLLP